MNLYDDAISQHGSLNAKPRVLFLDNDDHNLVSFKANFRNQFEVFTTVSPLEAYNLIEDQAIQVVLVDHRMPTISGVDFLGTVARDYPGVQRVLVTGDCDVNLMREAINKAKIVGMLMKPFNPNEISQVIEGAWSRFKEILEKDVIVKQLRRQNQQFEFMLRQRLLSEA